ncbi:hypothetical protein ACGFMK_23970, partial [Amycolatopsis sp. NPDC049252]
AAGPQAAGADRAVAAAAATPADPARPAARPGLEQPAETSRPSAAPGRLHAVPRPVRAPRAAAPAMRPDREPDRGPGAVQSVLAANRPPHRRTPKPDVTVVETPPVERPPAPPAPPPIVVVHAPVEAAAVPAFWERRQLGRLTNRIVR